MKNYKKCCDREERSGREFVHCAGLAQENSKKGWRGKKCAIPFLLRRVLFHIAKNILKIFYIGIGKAAHRLFYVLVGLRPLLFQTAWGHRVIFKRLRVVFPCGSGAVGIRLYFLFFVYSRKRPCGTRIP